MNNCLAIKEIGAILYNCDTLSGFGYAVQSSAAEPPALTNSRNWCLREHFGRFKQCISQPQYTHYRPRSLQFRSFHKFNSWTTSRCDAMSVYTGAPFPASCALNTELLKRPVSANDDTTQLQSEAKTIHYIPGNPSIGLLPSEVYDHLSNELATPLLDELHTQLWLVAKKSGHHIDALHTQKVKARSIIPAEDPRLHLIWNRNRMYIKPVPQCLLNYEFWVRYLKPLKRVLSSERSSPVPKSPEPAASVFDSRIAIGFMRSYAFLIKSPLDFAIAKESYLIPTDINWIQWSIFINHFRVVEDDTVAKRYHYGQLRLSRLNWAVRLFRPKNIRSRWFYENPYWSTSEFMERATFPLVFLFASVSIAL